MENNNTLYQSVAVPLSLLRATLSCTLKPDKKRPLYLSAVFLHRFEDAIRMVATDVTRLVVASAPIEGEAPEWADQGIMIERSGLARALGYLASIEAETVKIGYLEHAARAIIGDPGEECSFRLALAEGSFPDYEKWLGALNVFEAHGVGDMASTAYSPANLKGTSEIAQLLDVGAVRLHGSVRDDEPSLVTFPDEPRIVMMLLPMHQSTKALPAPTAQLLDGPLKGTVAALRAHQTRWRNKAEKAAKAGKNATTFEKRVAEYEDRISQFLGTAMPALPAPDAVTVETAEHGIVHDTPEDEERAPAHSEEIEIVAFRAQLKGKKRAIALDNYREDVGVHLSATHGIAIDMLAPSDQDDLAKFFAGGLSPEQAADALMADRPGDQLEAAE